MLAAYLFHEQRDFLLENRTRCLPEEQEREENSLCRDWVGFSMKPIRLHQKNGGDLQLILRLYRFLVTSLLFAFIEGKSPAFSLGFGWCLVLSWLPL